ncbi:MAG TPA: hypothetical protein VIH53_01555 [Gemmatimonadaceae bacterium]
MPRTHRPRSLRLASIAGLGLLLSACTASDSALGPKEPAADATGHAASTASLTRIDLGTLGGASSYAADINSSDAVVGWSDTKSGGSHAFRWTPGTGMVDLGVLAGDAESRAIAIIDGSTPGGGQILGVSGSEGNWAPVVWSASGAISRLPIPLIPSFLRGLPVAFNSQGDVVGWDVGGGGQHGWAWSANTGKYDLSANVDGGSNEGSAGGISASGLVVLTTRAFTCHETAECWRTYTWSQTSGYKPIGTPRSDPESNVTGLGLNEAGNIVGWYTQRGQPGVSPYRWDASTGFTPLSNFVASGGYGYAAAVNAAGTVVGADLEPASGSIVATTWSPTGAITRLTADDPNASVAVAINSVGTIAGWANVADRVNHAVVWSSTLKASRSSVLSAGTTRHLSAASTPCLKSVRSILSRQGLFSCATTADRGR